MRQSARHVLQVTARVHGSKDSERPLPAIATSLVQVIPLSIAGEGLYHTLSLRSQTTGTIGFEPTFTGMLQQSFYAHGSLDEQGEHQIVLDVRKALGTGLDPVANPQDNYSLSYRNRFLELLMGDQLFNLSPLLASNEDARGAEAVVRLAPVRFGAMYFADPGSGTGAQGLGGFADITIPREGNPDDILYRASLGILAPLEDRVLFDVWQQFNPAKNIRIQVDTALQRDDAGTLSPAVIALARADVGILSVMTRFLRAWPEFEGTFRDTQSLQVNANVRLFNESLLLLGRFSLTDTNLLLNTALPSADRSRLLYLGAAYTIPGWATGVSLDLEYDLREDRLPSPEYDTSEAIARLAVHQPLMPFDARLSASVSRTHDRLGESATWVQRDEVSIAYDPPDILQYLLAAKYVGRWTDDAMPNSSIGLSLKGKADGSSTDLEVQLRSDVSFARTGLSGFSMGIGAALTQSFPWGHTLSATTDASVMYISSGWLPDFTLSATYGIPVEVPVSRRASIATVTGHVYHAITGERLPNVLVRINGSAAVSDRNGTFTFHLPTDGKKYLQIDRGSIPTDLIPAQRMPMAVETVAGSTAVLDVGLVEGSAVTGTVALYGFPEETDGFVPSLQPENTSTPQPDRTHLGGLGNIIVELANGTETRRKLTGPDGKFGFAEVRPGHYTIRILSGGIPSYHEIEEPTREIDLRPAEKREIDFRVLQTRRRIQVILSELSIELEAPAAPQSGLTITLGEAVEVATPGTAAAAPDATTEVPVAGPIKPAPVETAPIEPAPVEPAPVELGPGAPALIETPVLPVPAEPQPAVAALPAPLEPAPVEPSPVDVAAQPVPLIMPAQTQPHLPPLSWEEEYAATLPQPTTPTEPPAPAVPVAPAAAPVATVPSAPAPATPPAPAPITPAPAAPPATAPVTKPPAAPVPVPPAPVPTPPPITIPIPLPMPTPRPPVTLPVPTPTPQPFPP